MKDDYLNILFILLAGAIACFQPFGLLLFAYAFIGPAHYLTQISWMHKKDYFLKSKLEAIPLVGLTLLLVFFPNHYQDLIAITFITALALVFIQGLWQRIAVISVGSVLMYFYQHWQGPALLLFFLPTLVHVFLFTSFFILNGAMKRRSLPALLSAFLLIGTAAALIFFPLPSAYTQAELYQGHMRFFEEDITALTKLFYLEGGWD